MLWSTSPCLALRLSSQYFIMLWRSWNVTKEQTQKSEWPLHCSRDESVNVSLPVRWKSRAHSLYSHKCCLPRRKTAASHRQTVVWQLCASPSARLRAVNWGVTINVRQAVSADRLAHTTNNSCLHTRSAPPTCWFAATSAKTNTPKIPFMYKIDTQNLHSSFLALCIAKKTLASNQSKWAI